MVWCFNRIICDYPEYSITVELHWLEHEETVKMCSSHQGSVISEREKIRDRFITL
jgi:hypothetical protein